MLGSVNVPIVHSHRRVPPRVVIQPLTDKHRPFDKFPRAIDRKPENASSRHLTSGKRHSSPRLHHVHAICCGTWCACLLIKAASVIAADVTEAAKSASLRIGCEF